MTLRLILLLGTTLSLAAAHLEEAVQFLTAHREALVITGDEPAPAQALAAAYGLGQAPASGFVASFETAKDHRWAVAGLLGPKVMCVVGTPESNTVLHELTWTDPRTRPEPILDPERLGAAGLVLFKADQLTNEPFFGAPVLVVGGHDAAAVAALTQRLAKAAPRREATPALRAWFERIDYATLPDERPAASAASTQRLRSVHRMKHWLKLVIRSTADAAQCQIRVDDKLAEKLQLRLYRLERRAIGDVDVDDVMVPLEDGRVGALQAGVSTPLVIEVTGDAAPVPLDLAVTAGTAEVKAQLRLDPIQLAFDSTEVPLPIFLYSGLNLNGFREFMGITSEAEYEQALASLAEVFRRFGRTRIPPSISYTDAVRWHLDEDDQVRYDYEPLDHYLATMEKAGLDGMVVITGRLDRPRRSRLWGTYGRSELYDTDGQMLALRDYPGNPDPVIYLARRQKLMNPLKKDPSPWLDDLRRHLEATRRAQRAYFYAGDEPRDLAAYAQDVQPLLDAGLRPITSINNFDGLEHLHGVMSRWILLYHPWVDERWNNRPRHDLWQPFATKRRAAGEEVWWYHCLGIMARHFPTARTRRFAWRTWQYKVDGAGVWAPFALGSLAYQLENKRDDGDPPSSLATVSWDELPTSSIALYPDRENMRLLASRRLCAVAQGWEDYKLLAALGERAKHASPRWQQETAEVLERVWKRVDSAYTMEHYDQARDLVLDRLAQAE